RAVATHVEAARANALQDVRRRRVAGPAGVARRHAVRPVEAHHVGGGDAGDGVAVGPRGGAISTSRVGAEARVGHVVAGVHTLRDAGPTGVLDTDTAGAV